MKTLIVIIAAAVLAMSCEDKQSVEQDWPWEDPEVEVPTPEEPDITYNLPILFILVFQAFVYSCSKIHVFYTW